MVSSNRYPGGRLEEGMARTNAGRSSQRSHARHAAGSRPGYQGRAATRYRRCTGDAGTCAAVVAYRVGDAAYLRAGANQNQHLPCRQLPGHVLARQAAPPHQTTGFYEPLLRTVSGQGGTIYERPDPLSRVRGFGWHHREAADRHGQAHSERQEGHAKRLERHTDRLESRGDSRGASIGPDDGGGAEVCAHHR